MTLTRRVLPGLVLAALALPSLAQQSSVTNPSSTLTRPNDATPYAQNDLIASSTTAGSIVVPSFPGGSQIIPRVRLSTNKTSGWDAATLRVRLWSTAPTYGAGDNAAYAVATGAAGLLGYYDVTLAQFSDGAAGVAAPSAGSAAWVATGSLIYWDLQLNSAAGVTPAALQTFTLIPEITR